MTGKFKTYILSHCYTFFSFLISTGYQVKVRHELLLDTLGYVFPEEEHSYWLMTLLMWLLPTILAIAAVVDALLAYIYMKYAHPWKGILEDPAPRKAIPEAYPVPSSSMKKLKVSPKKVFSVPDDFM